MSDTPLLTARDINVRFGGLHAVAGVGLDVPAGSVVGLIGPNGAGKSTFFNAISGLVRVTDGHVLFEGNDITAAGPHERARLGIARSFQLGGLIPTLTALENVALGVDHSIRSGLGDPDADHVELSMAMLDRMELGHLADTPAGSLGSGTRREVEVARCIASGARLTLLDEPGVGLSPDERELLKATIRKLADAGLGVLLTDHDTDIVFSVSDRVVAMALGRPIAAGTPEVVRADPHVIEAYLGTST